jgi:hypothetical protein
MRMHGLAFHEELYWCSSSSQIVAPGGPNQKEMVMSNLESTLIVTPQTEPLPAENRIIEKVAIVLASAAMLAALLVCISTQGAPEIDLSVLVAP